MYYEPCIHTAGFERIYRLVNTSVLETNTSHCHQLTSLICDHRHCININHLASPPIRQALHTQYDSIFQPNPRASQARSQAADEAALDLRLLHFFITTSLLPSPSSTDEEMEGFDFLRTWHMGQAFDACGTRRSGTE